MSPILRYNTVNYGIIAQSTGEKELSGLRSSHGASTAKWGVISSAMAIDHRQASLTTLGLRLGTNLGLWLALIYAGLVSILFMFTYSKPEPILLGVLGGIILLCVVGVFPSVIIGGFTGWLIAQTLERYDPRLSHRIAFLPGLLICVGIALLVNLFFLGLQYIIFIPSIIYVGAGGYASVHLHREYLKARAFQQP